MAEMTPMMQRLCEAAIRASDDTIGQSQSGRTPVIIAAILAEMNTALAETATAQEATLFDKQMCRYTYAAISRVLGATP